MTGGHWLWESEEGRVEVKQLGPRFVVITLERRAASESVPTIDEALSTLAPIDGIALFFDAFNLKSFANEFRTTSTNHILANRKTIGHLAVLSDSALVSMAVSTANVVLGGIVTAFRDPTKFRLDQIGTAQAQGLDPTSLGF